MKHLIWDLDGTLIDSEEEILFYLGQALRSVSLSIDDRIKQIRMGPPIDVMLRESFSRDVLTDDKISEVVYHFRKNYNSSSFTMTFPFAGIDGIVNDTYNFIHSIITNKPRFASCAIIEKLGWTNKITSLRTPCVRVGQMKTKDELFSEVISVSVLKNRNSTFIGIGDTKMDCLAARNNDIMSIGVLWGSGTREDLIDNCDFLAENTTQLRDFLYGG